MVTYFVYILKCFQNNGTVYKYYKGMSSNVKKRYMQHKKGYSKYTKRFKGNIRLIYLETIEGRTKQEAFRKALRREKVLKKWTRSRIDKIVKLRNHKVVKLIHFYLGVSDY